MSRWLAETMGLAIAFAIGGTVAVAVGLPLAWAIDRARYTWVEDDGYGEGLPEGPEGELEAAPARPRDLAEAQP